MSDPTDYAGEAAAITLALTEALAALQDAARRLEGDGADVGILRQRVLLQAEEIRRLQRDACLLMMTDSGERP